METVSCFVCDFAAFRKIAFILRGWRGFLTIGSHSYADFMTYFGAFSLKKWRLYTGVDDLTPVLVLESSSPVHITLTEMIYRRLENESSAKLMTRLCILRMDGIATW